MDTVDKIIAYESNELDVAGVIELFQTLVDSGLAWKLQSHYGRTAQALIEIGHVLPANVVDAVATDVDLPALGSGE